jgi:predicted O-methyltransferase YrrM
MLSTAVIILLLAIVGLLLLAAYKIWRIHLMLFDLKDRVVHVEEKMQQAPIWIRDGLHKQSRQTEALVGVLLDLGLKRSLPPTDTWSASPDFLREISVHALARAPKAVAECGSGTSTIVLARCMQLNGSGHVYSLEHSPEHVEKTRQELRRHGLDDWATVIHAPLRSYELKGESWSWYSTDALPEKGFDMLVIDGPPGVIRKLARYPAGPFLLARLNQGGAVFVDDASRPDESEVIKMWIAELGDLQQEVRNCEKGCVVLWKT